MANSDDPVHDSLYSPVSIATQNLPNWDVISNLVQQSNQHNQTYYPNNRYELQPLHTVYISADQFHENILEQWSTDSLKYLKEFKEVIPHLTPIMPESKLDDWEVYRTSQYQTERYNWIKRQLATQPIKDLRIDFEDGYGHRSTEEEWKCAQQVAAVLELIYPDQNVDLDQNSRQTSILEISAINPPDWVGVRTKGLVADEYHKIFDLLHILVPLISRLSGGIITFPKIMDKFQVEAANILCETYEQKFHLTVGALRYELQIEVPRALITVEGEIALAQFMNLAGSRLLGFPFGTYDYTAALSIAAPFQSLTHPNADWAKSLMQIVTAGRNIWLSDGSTQVFPLGSEAVANFAFQRHYHLVYRALSLGIYQGWDMHPGQLITRYAANYDFFHFALEHAASRLDRYCERLGGDVTDEPATAEALARIIARGIDLNILDIAQVQNLIPALGEFPRESLEKIMRRQDL